MSPSAVCSTRLHILGLGVAALLVGSLRSFGLPSQGRMISRSPTVTRQLPRLLLPTTAEALGNASWASIAAVLAMAVASGGAVLGAALAVVDASEAAGVGASVPPLGFAQADTTTTQATQRMPLG
jgi:hypothetical protein